MQMNEIGVPVKVTKSSLKAIANSSTMSSKVEVFTLCISVKPIPKVETSLHQEYFLFGL